MPPPPAATTPISSTSIQVLVACGVSTVPSITSTAPMAMTRPVPYLSATAPATGCVMPHMSCAQANARLIDAMPRPVAELSGPMNSATDWRTPKISANTSPAATMMPMCFLLISQSSCQSVPICDERNIRRKRSTAYGSCESIRMNAMRQGSWPRFTHAWLVACCTTTSPALRCTSPSSSSSPDMMIA